MNHEVITITELKRSPEEEEFNFYEFFEPPTILANERGRIGYFIAWLLGVPASVLFIIFLIRGH